MQIVKDPIENRQVVLHVEVDAATLDKEVARVRTTLSRRLTWPGFRKGKVPSYIVDQHYGKERLLDEAIKDIVPRVISDALEQEQIEPFTYPRVKIEERDPVLKLEITTALSPEVFLGDYQAIRVEMPTPSVEDSKVDESIRRLQEPRAKWVEADGPVQMGDLVVVTSKGSVDDIVITDQKEASYLASEDNPNPIPGFSQQLDGMSPGEKRNFTLTVPDSYSRREFIGKNAEYEVALSSIKRKELPPLDDQFASSLGEKNVSTLVQLREHVKQLLLESAQTEHARDMERQVIASLVETCSFNIPPLMVEHEAEHLIETQKRALDRAGMTYEDYLKSRNLDEEQNQKNAFLSAETRVKSSLAVGKLAEVEGIEPNQAEVEQEAKRILQESSESSNKNQKTLKNTEERVYLVLQRDAVVKRLIEIASIGVESR